MSPILTLLVCGLLLFAAIPPNPVLVAGCDMSVVNISLCVLDKLCTGTGTGQFDQVCQSLCNLDLFATGVCQQVKTDTYMTQTCTCSGQLVPGNILLPEGLPPLLNTPTLFGLCETLCPTVCGNCGYNSTGCDQFSSGLNNPAGIHCYCPYCLL